MVLIYEKRAVSAIFLLIKGYGFSRLGLVFVSEQICGKRDFRFSSCFFEDYDLDVVCVGESV